MVKFIRYSSGYKDEWNRFVKDCRTSLFLFHREFMEYHSDRFHDESIIFLDDKGLPIALFPASRHGDSLVSHGGLPYGGLLFSKKIRGEMILDVFDSLIEYCRENRIKKLSIKSIPYIFHEQPNDEYLYALHRHGAILSRRDLSSIIYLDNRLKLSKGRKWLINKARKEKLSVLESQDWCGFHQLLSEVLERHGVKPVHTAEEMALLHSFFPENIKLFVVINNDTILAGALTFQFKNVIHTQYLATSEDGKMLGALDYLIEDVIQKSIQANMKFFSFGISTEKSGTKLNNGLLAQKEGFGARGMVLDQYDLSIEI